MYNESYYKNGKMLQLRPYAEAIHLTSSMRTPKLIRE